MLEYIRLRKEYESLVYEQGMSKKDKTVVEIFDKVENFIVNVINKDKEYYTKLSTYHFSNDDLRYCL